jgi:oligopeptide transport system substrate-binding protein
MFNFWPQFDQRYEPRNWELAVNNEAFRQSLLWGLDTYKAHLPVDPYAPEVYLQSTITPTGYSNVAGKDYVDLAPLRDFAHHPTWLFDANKARQFRDQARRELTAQGATFPIKMLMSYNPTIASWPFEVQVVAQQLVEVLGRDFIEPIIEAGPSANFLAEIRREGRYAFMKGNNGAVAPRDPESWVFAFQPTQNWNFIDRGTGTETRRLYAQYVDLVNKAKAIPLRNEARYTAFAEAEAFLIRHAFVIPYYTTGGDYAVYRYNFFDGYGPGGQGNMGGFEGRRMLVEPMTTEQWRKIYADWENERQTALSRAAR